MSRKIVFFTPVLLFLAVTLWGASAQAVVMQHLYDASVTVSSQSEAATQEGLKQALTDVIVKVTGNASVGHDSAVQALVKTPKKYVQSYRYVKAASGGSQSLFGGASSAQFKLEATFSATALDRALTAAQLPVWGRERPATLVWMAYKQSTAARRIVGANSSGTLRHALQSVAAQRGIRLIFPLMDLQDQQAVNFLDIWGNYTAALASAAQRYNPDAVLIVRVDASHGATTARWMLVAGSQSVQWRGHGAHTRALVQAGGTHLANFYAQQFAANDAQIQGSAQAVKLCISGVHSLTAYARLSHYLHALNALSDVHPVQFDGDTVIYNAQVTGIANFKRTVAFGSLLTLDDAPPVRSPASSTSEYALGRVINPPADSTTAGSGDNAATAHEGAADNQSTTQPLIVMNAPNRQVGQQSDEPSGPQRLYFTYQP